VRKAIDWIDDHRKRSLCVACVVVLLIALFDWRIQPNVSLGFLYVFPILLAGLVWGSVQIVLLALACALLGDSSH
jgi:two-component system sensor kinase FixL